MARNTAAPSEILLRILAAPMTFEIALALTHRPDLPEPIIDAIVRHPNRDVRQLLAFSSNVTAAARSRLAADPGAGVRRALAEEGTRQYSVSTLEARPWLTDEAFERLAADVDPRVRGWIADHSETPDRLLIRLAADPDPWVSDGLFERWRWRTLSESAREALLNHDEPGVRERAEEARRIQAAVSAPLTRDQAEKVARHQDPEQRMRVAADPHLPRDLVEELAHDPEPKVRLAVSVRQDLTERQRVGIDYEVDPNERFRPVPWTVSYFDDVEVMRRCAASSHLQLRRSAACSPYLPQESVEALAQEDDFVVRLMLAEHHPTPPAGLLLRMVIEFDGYTTGKMIDNPNFVRTGLSRFAGSSNPRERWVSLLDPGLSPATVDRLSRDDDDRVRHAATAHPRLPLDRLRILLDDLDTAMAGASNPALPVSLMHEMLREHT
ncbi:hypothetical protein [Planotetraspora phitsanulokensis]|uniref:hypothetical protein n=1 Tax=Planotetraspora phitsanulokensis TaxID=575192 RepID=UPI00194EF50F|nr:hypothetical protein [Planotetraspora phitsanulokensis]